MRWMKRTVMAVAVALCGCGGDDAPAMGADAATDARAQTDGTLAIDAPPAASCEGSTALFCEDFDQLPVGAATSPRWSTEQAMGALAIDATQVRAGHSLHVSTMGNGRARMIVPIAPPGNSMFGRMYAYVEAFPTAPAYAHYTLVEARGPNNVAGAAVRPIGGQYATNPNPPANLFGPGSDGGASGDWCDWNEAAPAVAGRWVCYEWQLDASANQIAVWIDGVAKPELTTGPARHPSFVFPDFTQIWFGWWLYQASPTPDAYNVWIDDVVVDTQRVGCLPPP